MAKGGARQGAGRKNGSKTITKYNFADIVSESDVNLTKDKLMERIKGVKSVKFSGKDEIIYEVPPSDKAIQTFFDFYFSKPEKDISVKVDKVDVSVTEYV